MPLSPVFSLDLKATWKLQHSMLLELIFSSCCNQDTTSSNGKVDYRLAQLTRLYNLLLANATYTAICSRISLSNTVVPRRIECDVSFGCMRCVGCLSIPANSRA